METHLALNRFWAKTAWLSLVLFVVGAFISRSLVDFSKYLAFVISLKFFWTVLRGKREGWILETDKKISSLMVGTLFFLSLVSTGYLLIWLISHLELGLLGLSIASVVWPLLIGFIGWRRGVFSNQEIQYWWFLNGLLWWFMVTFFLRDVEVNTHGYVKGISIFAFSFTLPMTVFYLFIKMSGDFFPQRAGVLFRVVLIAVGTMAIMGLPSLVSLDRYWPDWIKVADALSVSYNQGRLSSFHFVLDASNILAQGFFLTLGWALYVFFGREGVRDWQGLRIGFSLLLFLFFIFTLTKLLLPLIFMLLIVFLLIVFRDYYRNYFLYFLVLVILWLGLGGALLTTDNQFRDFSRDLVQVSQSLNEDLLGDMEKLLEEVIHAELTHSASFIYRLQHHIWGARILFTDPLSGVGPYAYTDYVIANYREDLLRLPYILSSDSPDIGLEEKRRMIMAGDIDRSLLSPHSDWVMITASGGIPGMFFYYGFFGVLLIYFGICYRKRRNLFFLGVVFALLAMLASGITEANFKGVHFHILTLYALLFLGSKFVVSTDDPETTFFSENSKTRLD